jgi:hypothetical protein
MTTNNNRTGLRLRAGTRQAKRKGSDRAIGANLGKGICLALLAAGFAAHQAAAADTAGQLSKPSGALAAQAGTAVPAVIETQAVPVHRAKRADFEGEHASPDARHFADWVVDSGDNRSLPFAIVDKVGARVYVFNADGRLRGAAPALLGLARGDDSVPGIGELKLSAMRPWERTTPAGRFVASLGHRSGGEEILWVDYHDAISMHRVINTNPRERRPHRLATPTVADNRISYGCINVPIKFYDKVVSPTFTGTNGIVYVLPETKAIRKVFASYHDLDEHTGVQAQLAARSAAPGR